MADWQNRRTSIGGLPVTVVSEEEAEQADFVVCGWTSCFPDDLWTTCRQCGRRICHRPHAPKRPPKICLLCAAAASRQDTGNA